MVHGVYGSAKRGTGIFNNELRIVLDDLWTDARSRQKQTRHAMKTAGAIGVAKRPQYLFTALTKCGICGA